MQKHTRQQVLADLTHQIMAFWMSFIIKVSPSFGARLLDVSVFSI
jgi:hypothetical protein